MTGEWLYVIELATGHVKVGRTASLPRRVASHLANAAFGGGAVSQVYASACADAQRLERDLLVAVGNLPGVELVHGAETFAGVTFTQAVAIAARLADASTAPAVTSPYPDLVADCRAVLDAAGTGRMHLADLHRVLRDDRRAAYAFLTVNALAATLRACGIEVGQVKIRGVNRHGVRSADLAA